LLLVFRMPDILERVVDRETFLSYSPRLRDPW